MSQRPNTLMMLLAVPGLFGVSALPAAETDGPAQSELNCVILPDQQVDVGSPVPGVIQEVLAHRSDRVSAGQVLARLESSVERASLSLAQARAGTEAEVDLRRLELGYDNQFYQRLQTLQVRQATSSQSLEDAQRVREAASLRLRLAEDRQREAALEHRRADALLALKTIRSPIDGVIVQLHKHAGEFVETQPLLRIARLDPLRVEVIAPLHLFGKISKGMQVAVRPETDPNAERMAVVSAVDAVADPGSGTFGVELQLPNPGLTLPAGTKCRAQLQPVAAAASASLQTAVAAVLPTHSEQAAMQDAPVCLTLNNLADPQTRALLHKVKQMGASAESSQLSQREVFGYLVVSARGPQESDAEVTQRLRAADVVDFDFLRAGELMGKISLGAYNGPQSAQRRAQQLRARGIAAEVHERTREKHAWRVDVQLPSAPPDLDAVKAALTPDGGSVPLATVCEPTRTAAR